MHDLQMVRNVRIPVGGGVTLAADIYRPAQEGRYPAIFEYTPYHRNVIDIESRRRRGQYFAERGYILVVADIRGTGDSEGQTTEPFSDQERQDGYDVVEWIAAQPWCTGNVGMWGISYLGIVCFQVAMQRPPHLKAIIACQAPDDMYHDMACPGGCARPYLYEQYAPLMAAFNLAPPDSADCGSDWADIWRQHLEGNVPWSLAWVDNMQDGPFWRSRSLPPSYDRIQCACFFVGGWADWYADNFLRAFSQIRTPKRVLIGPWAHQWPDEAFPGPRLDHLVECERWFDQFLKEIDTGVLAEPPIALFVQEYSPPDAMPIEERGGFRFENEWPLARLRESPYYLAKGRRTDFLGFAGIADR